MALPTREVFGLYLVCAFFFICTEALLKRKIFECMNGKNNYLDALAARTARRTRFQKL